MTAVHAALDVEPDQSEQLAKSRATFDVLALQQLDAQGNLVLVSCNGDSTAIEATSAATIAAKSST